jgi:rhomboid protease GluP
MDTVSSPVYTEDLQLGNLKPDRYLAVAQQAVALLRWRLVSVSADELVYDNWEGEFISIKVDEQTVRFTSTVAHPGYQPASFGQRHAVRFRRAMDHVLAQEAEAQKKLKYTRKEPWGALVPSKTYIVTPILLYINAVIFLAMVVAGISITDPDTGSLLAWGGNMRSNALHGEWWRLFTYMFLHGGILHLLANSYALLYIGMYLEPLLGRVRFTSAYILSGICAGLLSIDVHAFSVGVGASGAIFGLYGVFLALLTTNHIEKTVRKTMVRSILFFVVYNLMMGLQGNTDNAAHIGGLLSGFAIGFALWPGIKHPHSLKRQLRTILFATVATIALAFATLRLLPDDMTEYGKKMEQFYNTEAKALEVMKKGDATPRNELLNGLQHHGINYWKDNLNLTHELKDLDLPDALAARNTVLAQYCQARIKQYGFYYKKIAESTESHNDSITHYTTEIDKLIAVLKPKQ